MKTNKFGEIILLAFLMFLFCTVSVWAQDLVARYRLYNPNNFHHHYTTDANEYNALETLGWIQEGAGCYLYEEIVTIDSVDAVPYYRLYNPNSFEHHWTTDANEYRVLSTIGWTQEGADGFVFASQVSSSEPLYRLYNPNDGLHHWTMDTNERDVLIGRGFIDEGIACYVFPSKPAFPGFDFSIQEGDFWEFSWDASESRYAQGSSGSSAEDRGTFRVTLGPPTIILGVQAYEIRVTGNSIADLLGDTPVSFTPRWGYIAIKDHQILGSTDGITLEVIFDAKTGLWAGGGFFHAFPADVLIIAESGSINNDFISDTCLSVGRSSRQDQCETIAGKIICGDRSYTKIAREYFKEGVGPLGYRYLNSFSFSGGGFSSGGSDDYNIGLVASSRWGDNVTHILEVEPNNSVTNAMTLPLPVTLEGGSANETGFGGSTPAFLRMAQETEPNDSQNASQIIQVPNLINGVIQVGDVSTAVLLNPPGFSLGYTPSIEDWYVFTLAERSNITATLDFSGSTDADLDLFLLHDGSVHNTELDWAIRDNPNPAVAEFKEKVSASGIQPATYWLAVDAYLTPSGAVSYTLQIDISRRQGFSTFVVPNEVDIIDWYKVVLDTEQTLTITVTGGPSVVLTDSTNQTTLASSIPATQGGDATIVNRTLSQGEYLIGITEAGEYTLDVSFQ